MCVYGVWGGGGLAHRCSVPHLVREVVGAKGDDCGEESCRSQIKSCSFCSTNMILCLLMKKLKGFP